MADNDETRSFAAESHEQPHPDETFVVRHEETAEVDKGWRGIGFLRVRKRVETVPVRTEIARGHDEVTLERVPAEEADSGRIETLADGSISIPIYEEELVVTRRSVLKERVIVRKQVVTEQERVDAELRKEHVEFDADEGVEVVDDAGELT